MELGTVRFQLSSTGEQRFQGEVLLPVCTIDEMTWIGTLTDGEHTVYPAIRMQR